MTALILSGSYLESNRYLQSEGVRGTHATTAATVASAYFTSIIELPSFDKRPDRFTVRAALNRKLRGHNRVDWVKLESWTPPPKPEPLQIDANVFLFGDLASSEADDQALRDAIDYADDVVELVEDDGAPSVEDEQLQDLVEAKEPEPKPAAKPKRPRKPVPAPPKTVTSSIDDLFGDD